MTLVPSSCEKDAFSARNRRWARNGEMREARHEESRFSPELWPELGHASTSRGHELESWFGDRRQRCVERFANLVRELTGDVEFLGPTGRPAVREPDAGSW
jgi:hypothetical protein